MHRIFSAARIDQGDVLTIAIEYALYIVIPRARGDDLDYMRFRRAGNRQ